MLKADREHLGRVVALGCIVCRRAGCPGSPAEIHHPRTGAGMARRAPHADALPLCPAHHRNGPAALHVMGRRAWEAAIGCTEGELLVQVRLLLAEAA